MSTPNDPVAPRADEPDALPPIAGEPEPQPEPELQPALDAEPATEDVAQPEWSADASAEVAGYAEPEAPVGGEPDLTSEPAPQPALDVEPATEDVAQPEWSADASAEVAGYAEPEAPVGGEPDLTSEPAPLPGPGPEDEPEPEIATELEETLEAELLREDAVEDAVELAVEAETQLLAGAGADLDGQDADSSTAPDAPDDTAADTEGEPGADLGAERQTAQETEPDSDLDEVAADLDLEIDVVLDPDLEQAELLEEGLDVVPPVDAPIARRSRSTLLLAGLVVVLVAAVAVLAVLVQRAEGPSGTEKSRRAALDAARGAARAVFSYDYRHLDKDFAAGLAVTTGTFRDQYQNSTSKVVREVAPRYKAVVVADVSDTAVVTAGEDRAKLLVFLDQQSTSTLTAQPKITQSRLEMTMVRKGGRWLVQEIKAF